MATNISSVAVRAFAEGSLRDRFTFPEVISKLNEMKAESYRVDLMRLTMTVYGENGSHGEESFSTILSHLEVSPTFNPEQVDAALGSYDKYIPFLNQIGAAGVAQYQIYLKSGLRNFISRGGIVHSK